jgi:hypothetical protein
MPEEWKTLRAVVEIPVRGDFTNKDLRWLVEQACGRGINDVAVRIRATGRVSGVGHLLVKQYSRHLAATRNQSKPGPEPDYRALLEKLYSETAGYIEGKNDACDALLDEIEQALGKA